MDCVGAASGRVVNCSDLVARREGKDSRVGHFSNEQLELYAAEVKRRRKAADYKFAV